VNLPTLTLPLRGRAGRGLHNLAALLGRTPWPSSGKAGKAGHTRHEPVIKNNYLN